MWCMHNKLRCSHCQGERVQVNHGLQMPALHLLPNRMCPIIYENMAPNQKAKYCEHRESRPSFRGPVCTAAQWLVDVIVHIWMSKAGHRSDRLFWVRDLSAMASFTHSPYLETLPLIVTKELHPLPYSFLYCFVSFWNRVFSCILVWSYSCGAPASASSCWELQARALSPGTFYLSLALTR